MSDRDKIIASMRTKEERRQVIAHAAMTCFLKHGYAKTSLGDVAQQAGISRPLIYQEFDNKEQLFSCAIEELLDRKLAAAIVAREAGGDARTQLLAILEALTIEPWGLIKSSQHAVELFEEATCLFVPFAVRDRDRTLELLAPLIGDVESAEVFRLAIKGLESDLPEASVLRERIVRLVDRFLGIAK